MAANYFEKYTKATPEVEPATQAPVTGSTNYFDKYNSTPLTEEDQPKPEQGNLATDVLKSVARGAAGIPEALAEPVQTVAGGTGKLLDVAAGETAEVGPAEAGVAEYGGLMRDATTRKLKKAAAEALPYSTATQASQEEFSKQLADIQANKEMGFPERVYESGKAAITHPRAAIPSIGESGTQFLAGGAAGKALGLGASAYKQAVGINALLEGGGGSEGAREEIAKTPVEELRNAPRFQELEAQYGTDRALKIAQELAGSAAFTPSAIGGGAATALTGGGAGGRLLESAFGTGAREAIQPGLKGIARYAAKEVPKYMAKEIPEETIQGVTGQLGQNIAAQPYTGVPLTEGLVEQGVASGLQGAIGGGVYGGAGVGTDIARTTLERRQREAAGAIDEGNVDTTGTGTALLGADGSDITAGTTGAGTGAGGGQAQTDITGATQAGAATTTPQGAVPTRAQQVTTDLTNTLTAAIATNPTTGVTSKAALAGVNSGVAAPIIDAATQDTQEAQAALETQQDQDAQDAQALSEQRDEDIPAEIFTGSTIDGKKPERVPFLDNKLNQYEFAIDDLLVQKKQSVESGTTPPVANLGSLRSIAKDLGAPYLKANEGDLIHNIKMRLEQLRNIQKETTENGLKETTTTTTEAQPATPGAGTIEQAPPPMGEAKGETVIPPTGAATTTGLTSYDESKDTTANYPEGQEDQREEEQKVAPVEHLVNDVKVNLDRLTPTQRAEWDAATEKNKMELEYADSTFRDAQDKNKFLKAAGQRLSAERRRITGLHTAKEQLAKVAFANKIREGASLQTKDGEQVTAVTKPTYGRIRVKSASGVESWIATSDIKVTPVQLQKAETITLPDGTLEFVGYKTEEKAPEEAKAPVSAAADQQQAPSKEAIEEGNYPLTGADFQGIHVAIENPAGSVRSGTDANGNKWEIQLKDNYGSMPNVKGADKDHLDVFTPVGLTKEQEAKTKYAYVVDQYVIDDNGKQTNQFDEHKVMLGYPSLAAAKIAYLRNYNPGWSGLGAITAIPMADLQNKINTVWDKPLAPKKVRKAKAAFYAPPSGLEELQGAIKKLGGIRDANGPKSAFSDYRGRRYQAVFNNGTNALTMDDMATSLNQYGYDIDGENGLSELLYDSLRGNEYYSPAGHENLMAIQEKENFTDEQARQLQKYEDAVEEGLIDSTDFDDAIEYLEDDFNFGDIVTEEDLNDFWGFNDEYDEGTDVGGFEGGEEKAGGEAEEVTPYTPGQPLLKTYTQEEILDQQNEAKRLAAEKAAAEKAAAEKAQADREIDTLEDEMLGFGGTATTGLFDEEGIKDLGRAEPVQKTETVFLRDATKEEQEYDDARVALDYGNHTYLFIPNRSEIDIMPINAGPYDAAIAVIRTGQDRAGVLNRNNLKDWPSSIPDQLIEPLLRYAETKNTEGLAIAQNGVLKAARELAEPVKKTEIAPRLSKAQLADRLFSAAMFYLKSHPSSDGRSYRALAKAAKTNQKAAEVFSFIKSVNANFIKLDKADWQTADAELTKQLESLPDDLSKEYEYILGAGLTAVDFEQSIKDMQEQLTPAEIKEFVTETKPDIEGEEATKKIENKPLFSRQEAKNVNTFANAQEAENELIDQFGPGIANLINTKVLNLTQGRDSWPESARKAAEGFFTEAVYLNGKVYIDLQSTARYRIKAVVLHELGEHFNLERMLGLKGYADLQNQIRNQSRVEGSETQRVWNQVKNLYPDIDEGSKEFISEVIAKLGENNPNLPWYRRLIAKIKAFLMERGLARGFITGTLTDADMHELLVSSLKSAIHGRTLNKAWAFGGTPAMASSQGVQKGKLLAPNGKPSNLNAVQHAQVRTPEFVKWFGNWLNDPENASKVVDENGEPLVVYHTRQKGNDFTKFRSGTEGLIWFADSKEGSIMAAMGEGDTIEVYLNARSPFNTKETAVHFGDIPHTKYNEKLNRVTSVLEHTGDDLVYVEDESGIAFAVQNPNQIKSATGNNGDFSEKNDDILFSRPAPAAGTQGSTQYQQQYREWSAIISEGFDKLSSQVASPKLAFLSVQQLVEICKKYLPAAYNYEKYRRLRDGLQTHWVLAGDKVSALTHNILTKTQHGELTGVVQDSTISNVDASKAWTGVKKTPATDIEGEHYLAFTQAKFNAKYINQIIDFANQLNEQHTINKVNPLTFFNGNAAFNTLEDAQNFERFLKAQELSYAAFTGVAYVNPNTDRRAKHPSLVARYNAMPQASKDFYVQSNELLNKLADAKQETLEDHVREAILDGNRRIEMNKMLRLHYEANRLSQYYAPLSRYGKFWFYGNFTDGTKTFRNFETQKARDIALEEFKKLNGEDSIIADGKSFSSALKIEGGSDSFILQINSLISGAGLDDDISEKLRDDIYQMYLSTLPEVSLRHSAQHRKGTKGYEEDAERNFANHMTHGASQFSNMKWGKKMEQSIKQLRDIITMATAPYRQQDGLRKIEAAKLLSGNWEELSEAGVLEAQIVAAESTPEVVLLREVRKIRNKYRSLDALNNAIESGRSLYDEVSDEAFQMLSDDWDSLITRGMVDPLADKIKRAKLTDKAKLLRAAKDLRNSFGKMDVADATEALDLVIEKTQQIYDGSKLLDTSDKRVKAVDIVDELEMTFNAMVNSNSTMGDKFAANIRQFGFLWNLGASVSSTIMNVFQTPGAAMPVAIGKHEFKDVLKTFNQAYAEFIASVRNSKYDENGNASIAPIMRERLDKMTFNSPEYMELKGELDALELFKQDGTVSRTQTMDIMGIGKEGYQHGGKLGDFSKKMGWMFHHAERLNREVTLVASYRLARAEALKKGIKMGISRNEDVGEWADAVEYARYVNDRSQLNYSPDNAARIFRGWPSAIALQFKKYQQGMLFLWGRTLADKLNGWKKMPDGTQEEKDAKAAAKLESQQAGRTFAALLTMQMSFAGALGLPLVGALTATLNGLVNAITDPDEPWDWRREVRVGLTDLMGEFFATAATKGLFNAFSTLGIPLGDIAGRMSLADTIFREPMQNMEGRDEVTQYLSSIAGPFGGLVGNVWEGVRLAGEGDYARGAETASPKVIRDVLKSVRFMSEGASSIDGAQLKEMSFMEIFEQMIGFGSAELEQKYAERGYYKEAEKSILSKRQKILHAAAKARREGDTSQDEAIKEWNERHPLKPITNQNISASINATKLGEKKRGVRGYTTDPDLELAFDLQDYDEE